ncbi:MULTISPECIES: RnfH family protein [Halomonadaceae]|uniref:RnfH family protein n=1 Tax=Halomonadaceae TaxID=28256 RepID=UPI001599AE21|nr:MULTISPECIES: RnfH family protein [Halomonas]QJQ95426.1 RnfH family protein [Halomonas sp. PA5]
MAAESGENSASAISVEVAFALPERQKIVTLSVAPGTTAEQAIVMAGLPRFFPELPCDAFKHAPLGIFGKRLRNTQQVLQPGDRVEVYRPLAIDPKEARRQRASQNETR